MGCFYEKGLHFECQGCGHCCADEPGYVFLSKEEIKEMASFLGMTDDEFSKTYTRKIKIGGFTMISLVEKENYDCVFLNERGCMIYGARPHQCRTYPFWAHVLESEENWNNEAKQCPGIGKGRKISKKDIERCLADRLSNNPVVY